MLFKKQICNNCKSEYDPLNDSCPLCGQHNDNMPEYAVGKGNVVMSLTHQIISFVLVLFGIPLVTSFCFYAAAIAEGNLTAKTPADLSQNSYLFVQISGYVFAAFVATFLIVKNWSALSKHLKKIPPYIIGIVLGFASVGLQTLYNLLLQSLGVVVSINVNEETVDSFIYVFPAISIIFFGIIGPIIEELGFRCGLFSFLTRINRVLAYIVTILIFALSHMSFDFLLNNDWAGFGNEMLNLPIYLLGGAVLTFAYDKFGPQCSALAHIVNNLFAIISLLIGIQTL